MNALTFLLSSALGEHVFKGGVDTSVIGVDWPQLDNRDGTFRFNDDRLFDPADPTTYPAQYTRTDGEPRVHLRHNVYAVFVQDHWKLRPNLTVDLGVRWDYDDAPGISRDTRDVGPERRCNNSRGIPAIPIHWGRIPGAPPAPGRSRRARRD